MEKCVHVNLVHGHHDQGLLWIRLLFAHIKIPIIFPSFFKSRSEEIPLEDFRQSRNSSPSSRCSSRGTSRSHTPSRMGANDILSVPIQEHQTLSNSPNVLASASATLAEDNSSNANSVETSFIAPKKKGIVETVWIIVSIIARLILIYSYKNHNRGDEKGRRSIWASLELDLIQFPNVSNVENQINYYQFDTQNPM